ncbi:hypothetical protein RFI_26883 [Reticulomyxa filosa]|uniref:Protein kinase domain-containing protein n=1 Tax=Reticulomyxa filosa TaxID=46433 RepID=X6MBS5_RETFI|nr:hypothetical protein RFI_26883 [Reticulomyxa filosa]|eukprot:ETO10495.1 hypothetical protein RFI_26883 [Reticulomyxa filosa]
MYVYVYTYTYLKRYFCTNKSTKQANKIIIIKKYQWTEVLLERYKERETIVRESNVRKWINELLQAVAFLHHHNIAHLDISPDSIVVTDSNSLYLNHFQCCMIVEEMTTYQLNVDCLTIFVCLLNVEYKTIKKKKY